MQTPSTLSSYPVSFYPILFFFLLSLQNSDQFFGFVQFCLCERLPSSSIGDTHGNVENDFRTLLLMSGDSAHRPTDSQELWNAEVGRESWLLDISKSRDLTTSLEHPCQSQCSDGASCVSGCAHGPCSCLWAPLARLCPCPLAHQSSLLFHPST